ncbi:MAG: protease complex subunit PrcB family protein [Candidatus Sericytochromatia bacterium]|nr:protease complex subunit PrcB family protein [Candidatus Sericytochromatia bacterium]
MIFRRYLQLSLLGLCSFSLLLACGFRRPGNTPTPTPTASGSSSPKPSSSPTALPGLITAEIRPTIESNDAVLAEMDRLKLSNEITDSIVRESFPVQITATGTPAAIQKLQKLAAGNTSETVLSFETLSTRSSRITSSQTQAVSDEEAWQTLWRQHMGSDADRPMINFEIETVLAVFSGQKRSGGHSVKITQVKKSGNELVVTYQETAPSSGNLVSQNLTSPSHLVKVRSSKLNGDFSSVRFEKKP